MRDLDKQDIQAYEQDKRQSLVRSTLNPECEMLTSPNSPTDQLCDFGSPPF